jgi:hypothetical protein
VSWPKPQVGQVIRYAYLWADEAREGQEEGRKDRPAANIVVLNEADPQPSVVVCPITHSPRSDAATVAFPPTTAKRVGLDDRPQWVVVSEANQFYWPGPDLRPTPGEPLASVVIGDLPDGFIRALRAAAAAHLKGGLVKRSE